MSREIAKDTNAEFCRKFGKRLAYLREAHGYTQAQLAQKSDLTEAMVYLYEHSHSRTTSPVNPKLSNLLGLAKAFDMSVSELLDVDADLDVDIAHINHEENEREWRQEQARWSQKSDK